MSTKLVTILSAGVGLLSISISSYSHHASAVVYDLTQEITLSGTVTDFRFVNPHVLIYFDVRAEDGKVVTWMGGMSNPGSLRSEGWSGETLELGDEISVTGAPARGGAPSVWVQQVILNGEPLLRGEFRGG